MSQYLQDRVCGTICRPLAGTTLLARAAAAPLRAALSGAALRPYIRRDAAARPAWLALTRELLRRTHRYLLLPTRNDSYLPTSTFFL